MIASASLVFPHSSSWYCDEEIMLGRLRPGSRSRPSMKAWASEPLPAWPAKIAVYIACCIASSMSPVPPQPAYP